MSLQKKISVSVLNMSIQRVLDFVTILAVTALVVRSLSRPEFGMLSIVLSYGLIFNILNVSISSVLIRDYTKLKNRIGEYMHAFFWFSLAKGALVLVLSIGIGFFLYRRYHDPAMIMVVAVNTVTTALLILTEPYTTLLSVDFRQTILTKINLITSLANIILSAGVILLPTALFVSAKNAIIATIGLALVAGYAVKLFPIREKPRRGKRFLLVKESFMGFSLWSHLIGVMTDIIYRADLLLLGWFNAPFSTMGNYNIALQVANFSKLLPQILQYNATLGLGHSDDSERRERITFFFVKYSFLLSCGIMAGYLLFGRMAIRLFAGNGVEEIYTLGLYIIAGLCIFNTFRPLISYGIVVHDIRECFFYAILPAGMGTLGCYVVMGMQDGALGLAKANLLGGLIMAMCTLAYIHWKTEFRWRITLITDTEREFIEKVRTWFRSNSHRCQL